jgi:aminoglycoside phosphotransferase (APT) family kinase protein
VTWRAQGLPDLLASAGLAGLAEEPFPTDGWSGATFTSIRRGSERFVLKRTSAARDWIVRATLDHDLREAVIASTRLSFLGPAGRPGVPYIGAAADGDAAAILMPDLSAELIAWERPSHAGPLSVDDLDRVLDAVARLHAMPWWVGPPSGAPMPWCPLAERILLLARPSAERYRAAGNPVGDRFLAGWDAFDRWATPAARDLVERLSTAPAPLLDALSELPSVGLHGDLKLANVALSGPDDILLIDWQMTTYAPVAVELGWLLVSNVDLLPEPPDAVIDRYRTSVSWHSGRYGAGGVGSMDLARVVGDWEAQVDLAFLVGLLLRGWRKGLDAESGVRLASGLAAEADLAWWCRRAIEAAERRL